MSIDFSPVENKFKEIRRTSDYIEIINHEDSKWQNLRNKLGSLKDQVDDIDIFVYRKFGNYKNATLPYGLEKEMYWRDLKMAYKMQALIYDYQKAHHIKNF